MKPTLYYNKIIPSSWAAPGTTPGFVVDNLNNPRVRKMWRGSGELTLVLPSSMYVASLWIQDANFSSATLELSNGEYRHLNIRKDEYGVTRGFVEIEANISSISFNFPSQVSIGAMYVFSNKYTLPRGPLLGFAVNQRYPQISSTLRNGVTVTMDTGTPFKVINASYTQLNEDEMGILIRAARAAEVGLYIREKDFYLCRFYEDRFQDTHETPISSTSNIVLREVV